jgi:hypothetical protein
MTFNTTTSEHYYCRADTCVASVVVTRRQCLPASDKTRCSSFSVIVTPSIVLAGAVYSCIVVRRTFQQSQRIRIFSIPV